MIFKHWITLCLLSGFIASTTSAQVNDYKVIIVVQDQLGNVIPNARIIISDAKNKEIKSKTDKSGICRFNLSERGKFTLKVISNGFNDLQRDLIILHTQETTKIAVTLEILTIESKVEIDNSDSTDANDYGFISILTAENIQKLPDDPEEFIKALRRIAGETATGADLPITVNGISGLPVPPKQQIEQIRIDRNSFSAKYAGINGGGIQFFTSSNITNLNGFASFSFADSRLNATDPFINRRVPNQLRDYRVGLSGPLGKKTSFMMSASRSDRDLHSTINAIILDSFLRPIEYKETFPSPNRNHSFNLGVSSDFIKKHKLYLNYSLSLNHGRGLGVGLFNLPERASRSDQQNHIFALSHTYLKTANFLTQTRITARYNQNRIIGESDRPSINVADSFFSGGSPSNSLNKYLNLEIANDTSRYWKTLALEYGFSLRHIGISQNSKSNFNGTYNFTGRVAPRLDANYNPIFDNEGNTINEQITSLESYRRTLLFRQLNYTALQIRALGGGFDQFSISGGNNNIYVSQYEYSLYVQGNRNLGKNFGISLGLRYENQNNIKSIPNFAPRLSFIWSPDKKANGTKIWSLPRVSAGAGFFYSRVDIENTVSVLQTNRDRSLFIISSPNSNDPILSKIFLDAFPNSPPIELLERLSLPQSRKFFDYNFRNPFDFITNLTLNKRLPNDVSIGFSITNTHGFRRQLITNINAPLSGILSPKYPFDNAASVFQINSNGKADTTIYSVNVFFPQLIRKFKKNTALNLRYNHRKSSDNITFGSGLPFDAYDFSQEFGPSISDGVHVFSGYISQTLPFNLSVGGNWMISNGTKFNIITGRDSNGDGFYNERPAFAADLSKPGVISTKYGFLDPNPLPGDRIIPRNIGRGASIFEFDINLVKTFVIGKSERNNKKLSQRVSISALITNIFNINNKGIPISNMASPRFLNFNSSGGFSSIDSISSTNGMRSMKFTINYNF